ncbi:hypothetical protein H206_00268 [Candidatus Electrothrix aarhusensis]|uniref:Uncharacterized protein n=1 Tax=Candidatus Electrothrix aarhusensis TaxID=1859131 RepID=A0A444J273_9BACT|nr:hypothetical protein H206_00268 [Candidatus Electrothrix aarhusensis]
MPYSDFTLKKVKENLGISVVEDQELYSSVDAVGISEYLAETLRYNVPLALAVGTEKVRSELIIANMLLEVRRILNDQVSFFSGVRLDIDKQRDLNGFCDFVISKSPEQYYLNAPVVAVVEAKNENIGSGLGQCIAEMYASRLFNEQEGVVDLAKIYGAVTTGNAWKFLKYEDGIAYIDVPEYHITDPGKIVGILVAMVNQEA